MPGDGGHRSYFSVGDVEPRPLYLCLGGLGGIEVGSFCAPGAADGDGRGSHDDSVDVHDGHYLVGSGIDSGISSDDEQWVHEGQHAALDAEEVARLQHMSAVEVAGLYLGHA